MPAAFSLHAVVRSGTQRKGYFQQIGAEIYEEATAAGWQLSSGVCNDKSIGAVVKYMGWKTPGPLPVKLCPPLHTGRGVESELEIGRVLGCRVPFDAGSGRQCGLDRRG